MTAPTLTPIPEPTKPPAEPEKSSSGVNRALFLAVGAWIITAILLLLVLAPRDSIVSTAVAHLGLFASISATACVWALGMRSFRVWWIFGVVGFGVAFAAITEIFQEQLVDDRAGEVSDFWYNTLGVGLGVLVALILIAILNSKGRRLGAFASWLALLLVILFAWRTPAVADVAIDCGDAEVADVSSIDPSTPALQFDGAALTATTASGTTSLSSRSDPIAADTILCTSGTSGSFTLAVAVASTDLSQSGPTRIVTSSIGVSSPEQNFHLGQDGDALSVRVKDGRSGLSRVLVPGVFTDRAQEDDHRPLR